MTKTSVEPLEMDLKPEKQGFLLTKKTLAKILTGLVIIYVGSIVITYLASKRSNLEEESEPTPVTIPSRVTKPPPINYRLPKEIRPYLYELEIQPFIGSTEIYQNKSFTFNGKISMHLRCIYPTNKIVFHSKELHINERSLHLSSKNDSTLKIDKLAYDLERDFVVVSLNQECVRRSLYKLEVPFNGHISSQLLGFYKSSYVENGKTFTIASTDFEPTDARRAFPCFDEPAMKAKFQLTMIRHKNFTTVLFNAPLLSSNPHPTEPEWIIDQFEKSERMSTYLVAYVVSNFEIIKTKSAKYGVDIAVAGRAEAIRNGDGDFALSEASKIIDFYSDYFGVNYPMAKSTQVAIPDFNSGAMENWGLVMYRESAILYNPLTDTLRNKKRVSEVIAHELAHQWNGNLVTMKWWNDLWLNEGFANWIENIGMNHTHPEWRDLDYFFVTKTSVMVKDSLLSSHPINFKVNNPSEIGGLFDGISYDKGSSIIRMMNAFLTEKTFRKGVSNYLKKYKYGNAVQDNLWQELTHSGHQDQTLDSSLTVKQIMDTWTLKKGYPVVNIKRNSDTLHVTQRWFLLNPLNKIVKTHGYHRTKWFIPITFTTDQEKDFQFEKKPLWLKPHDNHIKIKLIENPEWIIGNVKHSGFYRVNYDSHNWNILIRQLLTNHLAIDSTSRAALLDDSFNLGRAEVINQLTYFNITSYLVNETDPLPFEAAFDGLDYIYDMLEGDFKTLDLFNKYYMRLLERNYAKFGWDLNLKDSNEVILQTRILARMCRSGNEHCINQAKVFYNNWINFNETLPLDFKDIIYSTVIQNGGRKEWEEMYEMALKTGSQSEKLRLLKALAMSKDLTILKFYLSQTSNEEIVKKQDEPSIIARIANNPYGQRLILDYLDKNWNSFIEKYGHVAFTLPRLVEICTRKFHEKFDIELIERFLRNHDDTGIAGPAFVEALEKVQTNHRWTVKNFKDVQEWLLDYFKN